MFSLENPKTSDRKADFLELNTRIVYGVVVEDCSYKALKSTDPTADTPGSGSGDRPAGVWVVGVDGGGGGVGGGYLLKKWYI